MAKNIGGCKKRSRRGTGNYARYRNENRWLRNKIRRMNRHLRHHPNDDQCWESLANIES